MAVVTGVGSVEVDDIRSQLREFEAEITLQVVRVAVRRPTEVARALRQAAGASLDELTRGGGKGVEALDDVPLVAAAAPAPQSASRPVGSAEDRPASNSHAVSLAK